jgi:hypothetical protein
VFSNDEIAPISLACQPTCGFGGGDLRFTNLDSIKDCRLSPRSKQNHRLRTSVKPTTGVCDQAEHVSQRWENLPMGDRLELAEKVLIARGIPASKNAIRKMARYGKGLNH